VPGVDAVPVDLGVADHQVSMRIWTARASIGVLIGGDLAPG
jgi:hypothetical protein